MADVATDDDSEVNEDGLGSVFVLEVKVDVLIEDIFEDGLEESMTSLLFSVVVSVN